MANKSFTVTTQINLPTTVKLEFSFDEDSLRKLCTGEDAACIGSPDHLAEFIRADSRLMRVTRTAIQSGISAGEFWSFLADAESEEVNHKLAKQVCEFVRQHDANALPSLEIEDETTDD